MPTPVARDDPDDARARSARDEDSDGLECFSTEGIVPVIETADDASEFFPSERLAHVVRSSSPVVVPVRQASSIRVEWWTMAAGIAVVAAGIASVWIGTPHPPAEVAAPATGAPVSVATPSPVAAAPAISDREAIEGVLRSYERAYDVRDAASAAVIWPRVDARALSRAFNTLAQQDLSFDSCELRIVGARANAQCTGEIRYIRRVGDHVQRARRVSWSFVFERVGDRWQIAHVTAH